MICRIPVALNALCTSLAAMYLVPVALMYPSQAAAVVARRPEGSMSYVVVDAALCFGPLLFLAWLAVGVWAVRTTWETPRGAAAVNGAMLAGWALVGTVALGIVAG